MGQTLPTDSIGSPTRWLLEAKMYGMMERELDFIAIAAIVLLAFAVFVIVDGLALLDVAVRCANPGSGTVFLDCGTNSINR